MDDGTSRFVITLNQGEMVKLAKSIPVEILKTIEIEKEYEAVKNEFGKSA